MRVPSPSSDASQFAKLYQRQSPPVKMAVSAGLFVFACVGVWATDKLETKFPSKVRKPMAGDSEWQDKVKQELE